MDLLTWLLYAGWSCRTEAYYLPQGIIVCRLVSSLGLFNLMTATTCQSWVPGFLRRSHGSSLSSLSRLRPHDSGAVELRMEWHSLSRDSPRRSSIPVLFPTDFLAFAAFIASLAHFWEAMFGPWPSTYPPCTLREQPCGDSSGLSSRARTA